MGKGKVHPSPAPPAAAAGAGAVSGEVTAEAVLMRLLPAAVLTAAAPLGADGKEVLAYLVLASLRSSPPPSVARGAAHPPELGCGCFACYTAYWSRWDGSPEADREAIHRAIEAFEDHLARKEGEFGGGGKGRRGRKKRAAAAAAKEKAAKGKELAVDPTPPPPPPPVLPVMEEAPKDEDCSEEFKAEVEVDEDDATTSAAAGEDAVSGGEEEKRRRGWGAVLNWRSWGLWGSH